MAKEIIEKIKNRFPKGVIRRIDEKSKKRVYIHIDPAHIIEVSKYIFHDLDARFAIATGMDTPDGIEIFYHYAFDKTGRVLSVCVLLDRQSPEIESLAPHIKATEWIEREIHELLGVDFKNHPNLAHLVLSDDWPEGKYPLRKDFKP